FDPAQHGATHLPVTRPHFYAIVSAHSLATTLARKASGRVDGFIVEDAVAGGHNAPPRGALRLNERGEPIYGERDAADLSAMRALDVPFWLAGGTGSPSALQDARAAGAAGIQVGTAFAYAEESGFSTKIKRRVLAQVATGTIDLFTDPRASPTGFPFKIVQTPTLAQQDETRVRRCDLGYLRTAARRADGKLTYRCAAAPVDEFVAAGGTKAETEGRKCLCNGLFAAVGLAQSLKDGTDERPLVTSGESLRELAAVARGRLSYSASDVLAYLLGEVHATA
ncbi:MAG TPA: nitronate monooxygenase, partial [Gemmatimonadaceae bacterium]|nr:nitronate monooxygenase [Gemmatimonadaceae bacterium]